MADDVQAVEQGNTEQSETTTDALTSQPAVEATQPTPGQDVKEAVTGEAQEAKAEQPKPAEGLLSKVEEENKSETKEEVPEAYEAFKGEYLDEKGNEEIVSLAKEKQLTQAQANVLAEGYDLAMKSLMSENQKALEENVKAFEADGEKGRENALLAVKALDHIGIKEHFAQRGYDNDYTLIKALAQFGKLISEDKIVTGATSGPAAPQSPYGEEWK